MITPRVWAACALGSMGLFLAMLSFAAPTPASFTLTPGAPTVTYTDGPLIENPTHLVNGTPICTVPNSCSTFVLTVSANSLAATHDLTWTVEWPVANVDMDIFVLTPGGALIAANLSTADPSAIILPIPANGTVYHLVVESSVGTSILTGTASLTPKYPTTMQGAGEPPRFENYPSGPGQANSAGEPSIGIDWNPNVPTLKDITPPTRLNTGGVAFFTAINDQWRSSFDDCSSPAVNVWQDMNSPIITGLDPIGFVDHFISGELGTSYPPPVTPGRVFALQLAAGSSTAAYSDDDGTNWTSFVAGGAPAGPDHETFGGGPYHSPIPTPPPPAYPNPMYYCSQNGVQQAECSRSDNGGLTWGPGVPIFPPTLCGGGIHGHVKVSPQGTVYVPNSACAEGTGPGVGANGVALSKDNGITWDQQTVPGSTGSSDPAVGIGQNNVGKPPGQTANTIYLGWISGDGHAHVAHSPDEGITWQDDFDITSIFGIEKAVFPTMVAGDDNRAAFSFLGTAPAYYPAKQVWHLYIATTYDGGNSWILVDATPIDPVQIGNICLLGIGCSGARNLLDFNGMDVDAEGRVLVAYADGCLNCTNTQATTQSSSAKGTIARQSGGRRLFSAFDPVSPAAPAAPQLLSTVRTDSTHVTVSWLEPDNGGSPVTGYNVYRSTTSGTQTFLANVSGAATNKYFDAAAPDTSDWYYLVTAVNAIGESSFCREKNVNGAPPPPVNTCTVPGLTIMTDATGDANNMQAFHDVQSLQIAETYLGSATENIIFTLKMASLATVPPDTYWPIQFTSNGVIYTARMSTFPPATPTAPVFEFYQGPYNALLPVVTAADPLSTYFPDGTIRIIVPRSGISNPAIGSNLTDFLVRISVNLGAGIITPDNMPQDFIPGGTPYTIVGNQFCRYNTPPSPILAATPLSGTAPLMVMFDASGSYDADTTAPADTIASYTFDFGDGSSPVTQASPLISHTYNSVGAYPARLTVTDSRGLASLNYAERVISVTSNQIAPTGVVSRKTHGPAGDFDVNLPLGGTRGIECRSGGANGDHTVVFTFPNNLTSVTSASVAGGGSVSSSAIDADPKKYIVNLTGVPNGQNVTITLNNAQDSVGNAGNVSVVMGVLLGDTTANGNVNSSDIGEVKANSGLSTTAGNFRTDITVNGVINSSDIGVAKSQSGSMLPAAPKQEAGIKSRAHR